MEVTGPADQNVLGAKVEDCRQCVVKCEVHSDGYSNLLEITFVPPKILCKMPFYIVDLNLNLRKKLDWMAVWGLGGCCKNIYLLTF